MEASSAIPVLAACYALGCVVPSYYVVKWKTGLDLRQSGSGTVGATNAGRILGPKAYVVLALMDILKGWVAPFAAGKLGLAGWWLAGTGLAVVAGHLWPAQLRFQGGKGLAAAYGAIGYFSPWTALLMWGVFGAGCLAFRSPVPGMAQAFFAAPLLAMGLGLDMVTCALFFVLAIIVSLTHRNNIREALIRRRDGAASTTESRSA